MIKYITEEFWNRFVTSEVALVDDVVDDDWTFEFVWSVETEIIKEETRQEHFLQGKKPKAKKILSQIFLQICSKICKLQTQ
jgi:hypothetical protein